MKKLFGFLKARGAVGRGAAIIIMVNLVGPVAFSQEAADKKVDFIETEVTFDQMVKTPSEASQDIPKNRQSIEAPSGLKSIPQLPLDEQQIMIINKSLKNAIEENKRLMDESMGMETELKELRGQREIRRNRINTLLRQKESLQKEMESVLHQKEEYEKQLDAVADRLDEKEKALSLKIEELKTLNAEKKKIEEMGFFWSPEELENAEPRIQKAAKRIESLTEENKDLKSSSRQLLVSLEEQIQKTFSDMANNARKAAKKIAELNQQNDHLRKETAKLHYNLANVFFERGDYQRATIEYKKVLEIFPYDAAAHYNLAFINGEFLGDFRSALEHYQQYLNLRPNAEDLNTVKEKILEAKLKLKTDLGNISVEDEMDERRQETMGLP